MTPADVLREMAKVYEEVMGTPYALDKSDFPKFVKLIKQRVGQVGVDQFLERWGELLLTDDEFLGRYKTVGGFLNGSVFASAGSLVGNKRLGKRITNMSLLNDMITAKRNKQQKVFDRLIQ